MEHCTVMYYVHQGCTHDSESTRDCTWLFVTSLLCTCVVSIRFIYLSSQSLTTGRLDNDTLWWMTQYSVYGGAIKWSQVQCTCTMIRMFLLTAVAAHCSFVRTDTQSQMCWLYYVHTDWYCHHDLSYAGWNKSSLHCIWERTLRCCKFVDISRSKSGQIMRGMSLISTFAVSFPCQVHVT